MSLDYKPLDEIDESDLQSLVLSASPERRTVDYKRDLPGGSDSERKEFLFDLSSFANAAGGHLIFGIEEHGGVPTGVPGLSIPDPEAELLRLENMARDGSDPRIPALQWRAVKLATGNHVVLARIPRSWAGPHMVTYKGTSKFYSRNSSGKYQLDVREIRALFLAGEQIELRIRAFRDDRLAGIVAEDVPAAVRGPKAVMHVIPLGSTSHESRARADLLFSDEWILTNQKHVMAFVPSFRNNRFITVDGLVCFSTNEENVVVGYTHVFLNGAIESVTGSAFHPEDGQRRTRGYVRAFGFEEDLALRLEHFLAAQRALGVEPPLVVSVALTEVERYEWIVEHVGHIHPTHAFDRDTIMLPELLLTEWPADSESVLRPVFDAIANAAGWPRSPFFNEKGEWGQFINQ